MPAFFKMSNRQQKNLYCFISDENKMFIRAVQEPNGNYTISKSSQPYPIDHNPSNLLNCQIEFGTNNKYFSLARSLQYPLDFIKDGAAILRNLYFLGKGREQKAYLTIIQWNGSVYELCYYGKFDFKKKDEDSKAGMFSIPVIDDSAWGVLSQNDDVTYAIDCSPTNPKAIKVLFDGITLENRFTFQTIQSIIVHNSSNQSFIIPFVLVNQDGDSAGVLTKDQTFESFNQFTIDILPYILANKTFFFTTFYGINNVNLSGSFEFEWGAKSDNIFGSAGGVSIYFFTTTSQEFTVYNSISYGSAAMVIGKRYKVDFDFTFNLAAGESIALLAFFEGNVNRHSSITPIVTNIIIKTLTVQQPVVVYGIRAGDLVQEIVSKATFGRYTIGSNYFSSYNKNDVCFSGDSIRGIPNAKIYSSFSDFFNSFDALQFMALRNIDGDLFIEKAIDVYNTVTGTIMDIGDAIDVKLLPASEYDCNEIEVGSPKQDYRHPSGRLEFNSTNTFTLPMINANKKLSLISRYRLDGYGIQFLLMDYKGDSTQDNQGDKQVFVAEISNVIGSATEDIETFENVNIDNSPLEPIIKFPLDNDNITFDQPLIKGIAPAGSNVNIYVDAVLDGNTTADVDGNWSYNIAAPLVSYNPGITTGIHLIQASYLTLSDPFTSITITVDTTVTTALKIIYPQNGDGLYNNKPLIKGVAQQGTTVNVSLNGVSIGSVVADDSCKWQLQSPVIPNGSNTLAANTDSITFNVNSFTAYPLITYTGSELDGFPIINNEPLIKGVAIPGTIVDLWLNYISYGKLNATPIIADANGNWEYQVVNRTYTDPLSHLPVILAPIQNGLSVISTSLVNHIVQIIVSGYKLNRPPYSSITGVIDNTVFNTSYSPKRMLMAHYPMLAAIMRQLPQETIHFQTADKNPNLRTVLSYSGMGGITFPDVIVSEHDDIPYSSLGKPIALLEYALIKTKTSGTFAKILQHFNDGGLIKTNFRGTDIYALPIGNMKMNNITDEVQEWKLLLSPNTTYQSLLNLYKNGLTIQLMKNSIYHSDYNTLHFVTYNHSQPTQYNFKSIYDDWFNNRNDGWRDNPQYIQKLQRTDTFKDQIISNGISSIELMIYGCIDGVLVDTISYNAVSPAPINPPDVVMEASIDMHSYPEGQYFFVQKVSGTPISISERIQTKDKWKGTILINSGNSLNKVGAFFSTGFKSIIRVEGLVKKIQPSLVSYVAQEEDGDAEMLYSSISRKRIIRFGTAYGLPDYLYLKIADSLALDELIIEGTLYVLGKDEKINPSDDVDGHPLYYYNVELLLQSNSSGKVFAGGGGAVTEGVILVVDAQAFGLPAGSLINISVD